MKPCVRQIITTILALFVGISLFTGFSYAKQLEFIREYSYTAGEADSKISCRAIALEQVKRMLLEELGTYLVSNTIVKDAQLSKDEIITYTAGAVVTVIIEERWDGQIYFLKANIKADDNDVAKSINEIRQNQENTAALEKMRNEKTAALKEIERLKKELAMTSKSGMSSGQIATRAGNVRKEYDKVITELTAKEFLEQGIALRNTHKYDLAVDAYSRALKEAPLWIRPYIGRGISLLKMDTKDKKDKENRRIQALADFNQALQLDPNNAFALSYHGITLFVLGKKQEGLAEMEKALSWSPNDSGVIANFGWAQLQLKQPNKALEYFTKSLELQKVKSGRTYYLRSLAYRQLGELEKANADLEKAALLGDPTALKLSNK
jgi:tetratricopeptide (TPR) repeat protein